MNRLADLRINIQTIEDAKTLLGEIARLTCTLAVEKARAEKRITEEKERFAERTAPLVDEIATRESTLKSFIMTHKTLFEKPRKVATEFGSFGLQYVKELEIGDEVRLVQYCLEEELEGALKIVRTPIKDNIKQRLEDGQKLPGCSIKEGDTAVYKVAKSLIDAEVEKVIK